MPNSHVPYNVPRKRLYVDVKIQSTLILRVTVYWLACLVSMTVVSFVWNIVLKGPDKVFETLGDLGTYFMTTAMASALVLPIVIYDILRLSNRFVGPIIRLRNDMQRLAGGYHVEPIKFREDDFWHEMADAFNANLARQQQGDQADDSQADRTVDSEQPVGA